MGGVCDAPGGCAKRSRQGDRTDDGNLGQSPDATSAGNRNGVTRPRRRPRTLPGTPGRVRHVVLHPGVRVLRCERAAGISGIHGHDESPGGGADTDGDVSPPRGGDSCCRLVPGAVQAVVDRDESMARRRRRDWQLRQLRADGRRHRHASRSDDARRHVGIVLGHARVHERRPDPGGDRAEHAAADRDPELAGASAAGGVDRRQRRPQRGRSAMPPSSPL